MIHYPLKTSWRCRYERSKLLTLGQRRVPRGRRDHHRVSLRAALEESDPLIFLKAARNVARARGMSSHELPAGPSGLSPALEEDIRQILVSVS